jgi:hypothetical protein
METHNPTTVRGEYSPLELFKFLGVIVGITAIAILLHAYIGSLGVDDWLRWFMGTFFLVFGTFKLVGYTMFTEMFSGYDVVAKHFRYYAYAYPFVELALALAYLTDQLSPGRDWATLIIMALGSIGVAQELKRRAGIHCACLGNVIKLPLSTVSLVEDIGMGLMAAAMLVH